VIEIRGSFTNVMGLPTQRLYPFLKSHIWCKASAEQKSNPLKQKKTAVVTAVFLFHWIKV
jgi:predicted house-cleaning NTP pyrophosphatase (Maf/HAM1 superfamily)